MSTPVDIKAEAIALYALGYSCRNVEGQLKAMFPGVDVPNYATIARWVRVRPGIGTRLRNQYTVMRCWQAAPATSFFCCSRPRSPVR